MHYYNPDNKVNAQFLRMSEADIENWYDRTFQLFLACMSVVPYLNYKSDIMGTEGAIHNS